MTQKQFIKIIDGAYGTSLVDFTGVTHPVILTCEEHGEFRVSPAAYINHGARCSKCVDAPDERLTYVMDVETFDKLFNGGEV